MPFGSIVLIEVFNIYVVWKKPVIFTWPCKSYTVTSRVTKAPLVNVYNILKDRSPNNNLPVVIHFIVIGLFTVDQKGFCFSFFFEIFLFSFK